MELKEKRRVLVTETLPIARPTVTGLLETFQLAFRGKDKPVRVLYSKGEDLLVERSVLKDEDDPESPFLTPYQMIRQHSELEIQEIIEDPLRACCKAVQDLRDSVPLQFIVVGDFEVLTEWLPKGIDLRRLLGVELFIDPDTPEECLFFCGSEVSPMIRDIEKAICCRMV